MTLSGLLMFLSGLWITSSSFTHDGHQSRPRIRITHEDMSFLSQKLPSTQNHSVLRLVKDPNGHDIYAGSPNGLYVFREDSKQLTSIHVPLFKTNCQDSTPCGYKISLLKEGTNGNPLFVCGEQQKDRVCCQVSSNGDPVDCFNMEHRPNINEPSLHIGDALFFTLSGDSNTDATIGLYKKSNHSYTRPLSSKREQRYVKIIADKATNSLEGKLYSFYIEMNTNKDPEMPLWIPKVSQFCMADEGGVKNQLQSRWTSMLTARLFCGDEGKRISFTQLLDVAVLEAEDWDRSLIYALFRNDYNLSAICVYEMANISHTFRSSTFTVNEDLDMSASPRPGECVPNKNFPSNFLRFMQKCPEMNDWVKPARGPMMLSRHHHYTHLQVDRLDGGSILLLALENGRVHKVLDQDGEAFIIAEYEPFTSKTRVQSFLLDRSTKRLFLSSSSEVVRMDLQDCSVYGTHCCFCMQARDPYCGWSQDISRCSPANKHSLRDLKGDCSVCNESSDSGRTLPLQDIPRHLPRDIIMPKGSPFFMNCPAISQHASCAWFQEESRKDCVYTEQGCILLISSMSHEDEGTYKCVASENGHDVVVADFVLSLNSATGPRVTRLVLPCLLLLLSVIC